ncbi:MAG: phosphoribosylformylglycinamidine synthase [Oscillospiraceae bacterium]|jgi:phosphoribosylformylglycinamidine synthase|nr:phosphoribosylformylglycinamidine synthase [Oscillospiraceae bacterium]
MVFRCYTEKKAGFDVEARGALADLRVNLGLRGLTRVRILNRYDIEGISAEDYVAAKTAILSEPPIDDCYDELPPDLSGAAGRLAVEALPGQYDQRADSCAQCIQMMTRGARPAVATAKVYAFYGELSPSERERAAAYLINPVESREASPSKPETLAAVYPEPEPVAVIDGFAEMEVAELEGLLTAHSLAMDLDDLRFMQGYFRDSEQRDPTVTELKLIDTYWSDHCRHTTFLTRLNRVIIPDNERVSVAFDRYLALRREVYGDVSYLERPITLMDIATIGAKALKKRGVLKNLDESEEINACSIHIPVEVDGETQDWLLMFKNETHNHPTEIEPFGGAATCIGGAIRDPLSGRSYVYQAMRVTGAADPRAPIGETIPGKLPQRKLTTTAARGYSSYGNQIGLATGLVHEFYHPGYAAKRMEIGAVVGAVKYSDVRRETPAAGDVVILLGGRTGRDGIGGATGSSKSHNAQSLVTMASEVQKGNAPEERKIQRLFRDGEVTRMIKRCNDFGAGGVSVAIGELADGLDIDLSLVRRKYEGLGATELAISESQERMAVVVAARDAEAFIAKAAGENLEAYVVATVTDNARLVLRHNGAVVADLSRSFLSSNGMPKTVHVEVAPPKAVDADARARYDELIGASQAGLIELFDSSVGAGTVLAPFGGRTQKTAPQVMAALIPVQDAETSTCSVMAYGFDPYVSAADPYLGAKRAVFSSVSKLVAAGCDPDAVYLTFQEYFERLRHEPLRWGKPFAALLGALDAQLELGAAAIGGKDSMSGSFNELDVPPTLVSFAIAPADARVIISPEFKAAGHNVVYFPPEGDIKELWRKVHTLIRDGVILAASSVESADGLSEIVNMCLGNEIGFEAHVECSVNMRVSGIIAEVTRTDTGALLLGQTIAKPVVTPEMPLKSTPLSELLARREAPLEGVFPTRATQEGAAPRFEFATRPTFTASRKAAAFAAPRATVFSFPGTNSEIDTARAVVRAGGNADVLVVRNLTPELLAQSVEDALRAIENSQMLIIPGGFSGGDEPDGSAKFITAFFRNPAIADAVHELLYTRDGLMLGICNGFQALIKLGLVPYGRISPQSEDAPTLTYNVIGRHQAKYVSTRVASVASPWAAKLNVGDVHSIPISHGEGRLVAPESALLALADAGQIATQYCDADGAPSMDIAFNPNGSALAIEGLFSPDGRVFGKMGHTERRGAFVAKNIHGEKHQLIFESGVAYYK